MDIGRVNTSLDEVPKQAQKDLGMYGATEGFHPHSLDIRFTP